jgi:TfoX/Sxy family transcriptional regulator of competence genes
MEDDMASSREFVDYVTEQFEESLGVTHRKMFGEYGLFCGGRMFGMVCDDRLFVKPTKGGRAFIGEVVEAEPYPGARPCFLVADRLDDRCRRAPAASIPGDPHDVFGMSPSVVVGFRQDGLPAPAADGEDGVHLPPGAAAESHDRAARGDVIPPPRDRIELVVAPEQGAVGQADVRRTV